MVFSKGSLLRYFQRVVSVPSLESGINPHRLTSPQCLGIFILGLMALLNCTDVEVALGHLFSTKCYMDG